MWLPLLVKPGKLLGMSHASQAHGFIIEERIKAAAEARATAGGLPHLPALAPDPYTAKFDIPAWHDPDGQGVPTSIKTACWRGERTLVCLSDATRITSLVESPCIRLLVALYRQRDGVKEFREIREYFIAGYEWRQATGLAPVDVIERFAADLKQPLPEVARYKARSWKKHMAETYPGPLRWNPKIDSGNQRRLQCSIPLGELDRLIKDKSRIRVYGAGFSDMAYPRPSYLLPISKRLWGDGEILPFIINSPPRKRREKPKPSNTAAKGGHMGQTDQKHTRRRVV